MTDAKVTFGKKFNSANLEVFDENTLLTVYSIQFFETGSITIQGNYVSQWCVECVGLKQLVDKLEKSDSTLHETICQNQCGTIIGFNQHQLINCLPPPLLMELMFTNQSIMINPKK